MKQQDVLIRNAKIVDGTGSPAFKGDVLIRNGHIDEIAPKINSTDVRTLDAGYRVLAPGFIDLHRHCDFRALTSGFGELELAQGITTAFSGVCGMSAFPQKPERQKEYEEYLLPCLGENKNGTAFSGLSAYRKDLKKACPPINLGNFIGAGAVKVFSHGFSKGAFTQSEMKVASELIENALDAGAFGVSLGIMYTPECYSSTEEIVRMLRPLHGRGIVCAHIRGEGDTLVYSVKEVINIAKMAEVPLQISHFKAFGVSNWHDSIFRAIDLIENARDKGQDVTVDFYPYCAGSTILLSIIPPQFQNEGLAQTLKLLATSEGKSRLRRELYTQIQGWDSAVLQLGMERIIISSVHRPENLSFVGKSIAENCAELGISEASDWIASLLVSENGQVGILVNSMAQEDVDTVARLPYSMLISDSLYCSAGLPHPRLYGSFPHFIQEYCLHRPVLKLEEAIAKMTSLPAKRSGLDGRGEIKVGAIADLVLFDPEKFKDKATFEIPVKLAEGMDMVMLKGSIVWSEGSMSAERCGEILYKNRMMV